ncbi:MAG: ATP-binding protein [Acidobacteriota bacterium]
MPDLSTTQSIADVVRRRRFASVLRPLHLITAGYVLTYATLWAVAQVGAISVSGRTLALGLGLMLAGQLSMVALAYGYGESFRDWKVLGVGEALIAILQFTLLSWWVPETAPVWMVAWLVNLSHLASFLGWRQATAAAALLTGGFAFVFSPFEPWQLTALLIFASAQAYTIASHVALHYRLWRRELQGRELIAQVPVGLFRTDAGGQYLYVNPTWQKISGLSLQDALGDGWALCLHPLDQERVLEDWRRAVEGRRPFESEFRFERRNGRVTWLLGKAFPVSDRHGGLVEWAGSITDISDRVRAEEKAEQANRVKTDFLANMSHEIRTPIAGIVGASELLSKQDIDPKARSFVDVISTSAGSLLRLIDGLLDFSKIEAGKLSFEALDFSIPETVEAAVHMMRARALAKGIELRADIADDVPNQVHGDPLRLHQVLVNLVANAVKFTVEGRVDLRVRLAVHQSTAPEGGHRLLFDVSDTGIGIDPSAIDSLFEPFVQADTSTSRRFGGSGLGLSICKRIVDLCGGTLSVTSELGRGTTFTVDLPFAGATGQGSPGTEDLHRRAPIFRSRDEFHILLAEDTEVNRMIAVAQLDDLGYRVTAVANGREVLEALEREPFDLVLMDCQMPELDGYETTRRIRERGLGGAHIPIIAVTAHAVAGDRQRSLDAGMDDYISKPYDSRGLERTISRWLWTDEKSGGEDGSPQNPAGP